MRRSSTADDLTGDNQIFLDITKPYREIRRPGGGHTICGTVILARINSLGPDGKKMQSRKITRNYSEITLSNN